MNYSADSKLMIPPLWLTNLKVSHTTFHLLAGGISGTVGAVITCPLEIVKTRLQSSYYRSLSSSFFSSPSRNPARIALNHVKDITTILRNISRTEGIAALWKGVGPNLVGVIPARAIYFASYNNGKTWLKEWNGGVESSLVHLGSAASAGIITATATNPIWVIKTRLQLQSQTMLGGNTIAYRNSLHCMGSILKTEGLKGLYRGISASYLGVCEASIQWVIYEKLKSCLHFQKQSEELTTYTNYNSSKVKLDTLEYLMIASTAKLVAACIAYPHEVVRTRLRQSDNKYKGLLQSVRLIIREEGIKALYGGLTAHLMRVVPNAAIMFICYEYIINHGSCFIASENQS